MLREIAFTVKIVLYNLQFQFTKILWSNLRDLALVTIPILKGILFCNSSDSVPYFTDPNCKNSDEESETTMPATLKPAKMYLCSEACF